MEEDLSDIEEAGKLAEMISDRIKESGLSLAPAYYKLEEILMNYKKSGKEVDLVMPILFEVDFEHNKTIPDGRSIWFAYADVLYEDLCSPSGSLHELISSKNTSTGSEVVQFIIDKLNLPQGSATLVSPLAGSILGLGVKAFCKHSDTRIQ